MDKRFGEDDLKGLEEEIDAAVDRLFIEKKGVEESPFREPSIPEPFMEKDKKPIWENAPGPPPLTPPSFSQLIERLETQLLSLEWEISDENLKKTIQEVLTLWGSLKDKPEVSSILNRMAAVLNHMIKNEGNIRPSLIKFLLDAKETLKLLMKRESEGEIDTYKQLACAGIEARFSCLEELQVAQVQTPVPVLEKTPEPSFAGSKQIEEIMSKMESFSERLDEILKKVDQHLEAHEKMVKSPVEPSAERKSSILKVTILKVGESLIGVESDKVFKLFKVPEHLWERLANLTKVRIRGFEVRMIPLKEIFPMLGEVSEGEKQILMVRDEGEFKGLMIDRVLNRLSIPLDELREVAGSLLGRVHWIYQDHSEEIPVLDLKKC